MTGDIPDFVRRMRAVLPKGWFSDAAPATGGVLAAIAAAWQAIYALIQTVIGLSRISTVTGPFLDMASADFFAADLPRVLGETDISFRTRIQQELLRARATRAALDLALYQLTGSHPQIVEPARPDDTGGYSVGGAGYGVAGAWGDLLISNTCFVTAYRPAGEGIANLAGYGTGGPVVYGDLNMIATEVTDASIFACATRVLPLGCTAWLRIAA